ncbi:hypothetical protein N7492_003224 [Penicillium capsulatum]|uniref:Uncharacterized protein n=1 Tax=Penicillium capsulatum TaxID=69766 RepID=A0A9W9IJ73_9EURO|nr:hypothetical protein N7492_003224 [Penicillium capsulatum]
MNIWNRPAWSNIGRATPEKKAQETHDEPRDSSPLSDPPPSSFADPTPDVVSGPDAQLHKSLSKSVGGPTVEIAVPAECFQSTESAGPPSSNTSFPALQRILKEGKEVVISSDGEESDSSLEDPSVFFAPGLQSQKTNPKSTDKPIVNRPPVPQKYSNSITAIFESTEAAVQKRQELQQVQDELSRVKATLGSIGGQNSPSDKDAGVRDLQESALTSAFGDDEDETVARRKAAVQRLEALDQDRSWQFFDQNQAPSYILEFPRDLISPGSNIAALRVPFEPREELRASYCRVFAAQTHTETAGSLIRPSDIDDLFRALGARPQALNTSEVVVADPPGQSQSLRTQNRSTLVSIFDLFRDSFQLFADDTFQHALHILLRMTLDRSLTADFVVRSELQSCLGCLLENVPEAKIQSMEQEICTTLYETIREPQFQIGVLQHILPTCTWISLLRYRLAAAFLLRSPTPLTETVTNVLNLERLTTLLTEDKRFNVRLQKRNGNFDYGDLRALAMLLDIVINSSLYDLEGDPKAFNAAVDKLSRQINNTFNSIQDVGASHVRRMLAKEAFGVLHDRLKYAVRSKPPPKKTLFPNLARERNGNIKSHFKTNLTFSRDNDEPDGLGDDGDATHIPIRGPSQAS